MSLSKRINDHAERLRLQLEREQTQQLDEIAYEERKFKESKEKLKDVSTEDLEAYASHRRKIDKDSLLPVAWFAFACACLMFHVLIVAESKQFLTLTAPAVMLVIMTIPTLIYLAKTENDLDLVRYELKRRSLEKDVEDE